MEAKQNSAGRLFAILNRASNLGGNNDSNRAVDVWAEILFPQTSSKREKSLEVSEALLWMHGEMDIIRSSMKAPEISCKYPSGLYHPALERIEQAIALESLSMTWPNIKNHLVPEVLSNLQWCAAALPNEEDPIRNEDLSQIFKEVDALEKSIQESTMPDHMKALSLRHLRVIKRALRAYPICGAKAFQDAVHMGGGEIVLEGLKLEGHHDEIEKLGVIWGKIQKIAGKATNAYSALKTGSGMYQDAIRLIEVFFKN